ncbi:lytic transglycosylase domain-containing protein [Actinokineospora sp.]|uniref:lytic transglycosylase domain-containing protein n=1 Tax=Actinokineospora sp. TaxID=1872133 RepID=UPI003D6ABF9C
MRSRSLRPHRVRPTTALALITLCLAGAATRASTPAEVHVPRRLVPEPIPVRVQPAVPVPKAPVQAAAPVEQLAVVVPVTFTQTGIPANLLAAYRSAETLLARTHGGCALRWYHLAGIGRVESGHARGGRADASGNTSPRILGPALSGGPGMATIPDTDGGTLDGDRAWDRAVGPMQFIPTTWAVYATDGNADGTTNPHNIHDATAAAGRYLCSGGMDLSNPSDLNAAVYRYNRSTEYVSTVLMWMHRYSQGATPLPPHPPTPARADLPLDPPPPPDIPLPEPLPTPKPDPTPLPSPTPPDPIPLPEPTPAPPPDCDTVVDALPPIGGDVLTGCPTPPETPSPSQSPSPPAEPPVDETPSQPTPEPTPQPTPEPSAEPTPEPVPTPVPEAVVSPTTEPVATPQPEPTNP